MISLNLRRSYQERGSQKVHPPNYKSFKHHATSHHKISSVFTSPVIFINQCQIVFKKKSVTCSCYQNIIIQTLVFISLNSNQVTLVLVIQTLVLVSLNSSQVLMNFTMRECLKELSVYQQHSMYPLWHWQLRI